MIVKLMKEYVANKVSLLLKKKWVNTFLLKKNNTVL